MPPCHALHRRHARTCQRSTQRIHTHIGKDQNIQFQIRQQLDRGRNISRNHDEFICCRFKAIRKLIAAATRRAHSDMKSGTIKLFQSANIQSANRMIAKVGRQKSDSNQATFRTSGTGPATAANCVSTTHNGPSKLHDRPIVQTLIRPKEGCRNQQPRSINHHALERHILQDRFLLVSPSLQFFGRLINDGQD